MLVLMTGCSKDNYEEDCLRFGVLRVEDALPLFVADQEDLFIGEVEIIVFSNTREMDLALEAGVIDGILSDMVRSILLKNGEEDIRIVASASKLDPEKRKFAIVSSPESNIDTYMDINGQELAISNNSIISYLAEKMLSEKQVSSELYKFNAIPDIKLRMEALMNNSIDLALLPEPLVSVAENGGAKVIIADNELNDYYSQTVIIFREKYISEKPEKVDNFLSVFIKAGKLLNKDPGKYKNIISEKAGIPSNIFEQYKIGAVEPLFLPDQRIIADINSWMVGEDMTETVYAYEDLVTEEFAGEN